MKKRVLVLDDDVDICMLLSKYLESNGFETEEAYNGARALELQKKNPFDVVLCDFRLPDTDGLEMLKELKKINQETEIIIVTGYSDVKIAVQTIKQGAFDYVTKPIYHEEILHTIQKAAERKDAPKPAAAPAGKRRSDLSTQRNYISGETELSKRLHKYIDLVAPTDLTVIIEGETGTGKESVANSIHLASKRKDKPFVALDCGAIPKELAGSELFGHVKGAFTGAVTNKTGHFELANGGTLFLDEIGNLTYDVQVKLLRVLQERKVKKIGGTQDIAIDVRIIAATNEDLAEMVKDGKFREDLYHRLNEFKIQVPPLRERGKDIMTFADYFLDLACDELDKHIDAFSDEVVNRFLNYSWEGNLRELKNVVKRAVLLCPGNMITLECLPVEITQASFNQALESKQAMTDPNDLKAAAERAESETILNALKQTGFNKTKAAKLLNIDRKTLYNKMKAYNLMDINS